MKNTLGEHRNQGGPWKTRGPFASPDWMSTWISKRGPKRVAGCTVAEDSEGMPAHSDTHEILARAPEEGSADTSEVQAWVDSAGGERSIPPAVLLPSGPRVFWGGRCARCPRATWNTYGAVLLCEDSAGQMAQEAEGGGSECRRSKTALQDCEGPNGPPADASVRSGEGHAPSGNPGREADLR